MQNLDTCQMITTLFEYIASLSTSYTSTSADVYFVSYNQLPRGKLTLLINWRSIFSLHEVKLMQGPLKGFKLSCLSRSSRCVIRPFLDKR